MARRRSRQNHHRWCTPKRKVREPLYLGCRVDVFDRKGRPRRLDCGVLKFLGPTAFSSGRQVWCGIERPDLPYGTHDGEVDRRRHGHACQSKMRFVGDGGALQARAGPAFRRQSGVRFEYGLRADAVARAHRCRTCTRRSRHRRRLHRRHYHQPAGATRALSAAYARRRITRATSRC